MAATATAILEFRKIDATITQFKRSVLNLTEMFRAQYRTRGLAPVLMTKIKSNWPLPRIWNFEKSLLKKTERLE